MSQHGSPIGVGPRIGALSESFPASGIATAAGDQLHSRMIRQRLAVVAVEVDDPLSQAIAGILIAAADEAQAEDSRAVCWVTHGSLSIAGMGASFYREPPSFDQSQEAACPNPIRRLKTIARCRRLSRLATPDGRRNLQRMG